MPTKLLTRKSRAKRARHRALSREDRLESLPPTELRRRIDDAVSRFAAVIKKKTIKAA
ncbi:MAG: hypothetical protein HY554_14710 [Elusimicrobia bacterium]|nr:hypothetical protein [Elusimicrobiota bacterium]